MDKKVVYENVPILNRNTMPNSSSEDGFDRNTVLTSRVGESLPAMNINNEQTDIHSNLSRFPDEVQSPDDHNIGRTSSQTDRIDTSGQTNVDENHRPSPDNNNETSEFEKTMVLPRFEDAWEEYEQQKKAEEIVETAPKNEKTQENISNIPIHPAFPASVAIIRVYVREFLPTSNRDPIFSTLRNLFVRSFDEFYKQIETQLNLKSEKNLLQWLDETFDEEQESILSKKYRCFLLCGTENQDPREIIIGFLTLKQEEEGSIYIAQVAVRLDIKRRGHGAQLLQHLRNIYPPNTQYWGLCRRANRPALQFYLKQGAKFMSGDEIANKYGYDPELYAGFEFVDTTPVIAPQASPLPRFKPNIDNPSQPSIIITDPDGTHKEPSVSNDDQQPEESEKPKPKPKVVGCCVII